MFYFMYYNRFVMGFIYDVFVFVNVLLVCTIYWNRYLTQKYIFSDYSNNIFGLHEISINRIFNNIFFDQKIVRSDDISITFFEHSTFGHTVFDHTSTPPLIVAFVVRSYSHGQRNRSQHRVARRVETVENSRCRRSVCGKNLYAHHVYKERVSYRLCTHRVSARGVLEICHKTPVELFKREVIN